MKEGAALRCRPPLQYEKIRPYILKSLTSLEKYLENRYIFTGLKLIMRKLSVIPLYRTSESELEMLCAKDEKLRKWAEYHRILAEAIKDLKLKL